jgi:hypothetical protein
MGEIMVWAAIDETTGLVSGVASMKSYTFSQAVKEFKPREVRRMGLSEAMDSMDKFDDQRGPAK